MMDVSCLAVSFPRHNQPLSELWLGVIWLLQSAAVACWLVILSHIQVSQLPYYSFVKWTKTDSSGLLEECLIT